MRVTVMGLGLHGGGVASARYCHAQGAEVTVTDLREESALRSSVEALSALPIRFVLGTHEEGDFSGADMVIKNPAVRRDVPLLLRAKRIETDVSLFLSRSDNPLLAVTGTKGKSSTASAAHHILKEFGSGARLGGNITHSPLNFLEELAPGETVVLELSSFQLGDLVFTTRFNEERGSRPREFSPRHRPIDPDVSVITNIYRDHLDYYGSMERYVEDKRAIYRSQRGGWSIFSGEDGYGQRFAAEAPSRALLVYGGEGEHRGDGVYEHNGWGILSIGEEKVPLVPPELKVPGSHQRRNLLTAAAVAYLAGAPAELVKPRVAGFPGIPHRLHYVGSIGALSFYNDSASTIPEASLAAVESFTDPVHLICGGTDKGLDISPLQSAAKRARSVHLLAGGATERLIPMLREHGIPFSGPFRELGELLASCVRSVEMNERRGVVLFSPGCSSFEHFQNEFDRGNRFVSAVRDLGANS
ncbi:MAG: UDP-N-acetylmuramoyl-L-alanine--D-glutamate ligase [Spirochaetaceae bacterium]